MTEKQMRALNGEIVSYHMNKPMRWREFKKLPPKIQSDYLVGLHTAFGVRVNGLAKMFGVAFDTMSKYIRDNAVAIPITAGGRPTKEAIIMWNEFLQGAPGAPVKDEPEAVVPPPCCGTAETEYKHGAVFGIV